MSKSKHQSRETEPEVLETVPTSKEQESQEQTQGAPEEPTPIREQTVTTELLPEQDQSEEQAAQVGRSELPRIVEALLFATDEPISIQKLKAILPYKPDARKIKAAIQDINKRLCAEHHPFEVVEVAGGYQFRTVQHYHTWVRQLFRDKISRRLSQSALETLAIIAYKQPTTKAEIESIRGVVADGAMKTLLERKLIRIAGRSDKPGRPLLYDTTKDFLKYFGLSHTEDLPKLEEFEEIARAQEDAAIEMEHALDAAAEHVTIRDVVDAQRVDAVVEEEALGDEIHREDTTPQEQQTEPTKDKPQR